MIWQAKPRLVPAQEDCEAHPLTILEAGQSLEVVQNALRRVLGMDRRQDKPIRPRVPQPETGEKWVRFETGARGCKLHNRAREHTMLCMPGGMTQSRWRCSYNPRRHHQPIRFQVEINHRIGIWLAWSGWIWPGLIW